MLICAIVWVVSAIWGIYICLKKRPDWLIWIDDIFVMPGAIIVSLIAGPIFLVFTVISCRRSKARKDTLLCEG